MTDAGRAPLAAWILGGAGLIPALAFAGAALFADTPFWPHAWRGMLSYGAVILAFLGGAWWGLASAPTVSGRRFWLYALAVTPALIAAGCLLVAEWRSLGVLAAAFAAALVVDARLVAAGLAPRWWLGLRLPLSGAMAVLHGVVAWTWAANAGLL